MRHATGNVRRIHFYEGVQQVGDSCHTVPQKPHRLDEVCAVTLPLCWDPAQGAFTLARLHTLAQLPLDCGRSQCGKAGQYLPR